MQQLLDAVKQVKQTIQAHKSDLVKNEALTRYALIDIILNALGWDVHNPAKVIPEYTKNLGGASADYALVGHKSEVVAFVEAKALYQIGNKDIDQAVKYARYNGINYSILTDGNLWRVFNVLEENTYKEVMTLVLQAEPENYLLFKLLSLGQINLCSENLIFPQAAVVTPVIVPDPSTITQVIFDREALEKEGWQPISSVINPSVKLKSIRFPDGTTLSVSSTLGNTLKDFVEKFIQLRKISQLPVETPFENGKWYLLHSIPVHKNGEFFRNQHLLSNGWYLETSPNIVEARRNMVHLIELAGENPNNYFFQNW